jgi:hypothetical protein
MKKVLLLGLLFFTCLAQAAERKALAVETKDAGTIYFKLKNNPQLVFTNNTMLVSMDTEWKGFEIINVARYYFVDESVGIKELVSNDLHINYSGGNQVDIEGVAPDANIRLYSADGRELKGRISQQGDKAIVSLATLPQGIYIISTKKQSIKIQK